MHALTNSFISTGSRVVPRVLVFFLTSGQLTTRRPSVNLSLR